MNYRLNVSTKWPALHCEIEGWEILFCFQKDKTSGNLPLNENKVGMRHFISNADAGRQ